MATRKGRLGAADRDALLKIVLEMYQRDRDRLEQALPEVVRRFDELLGAREATPRDTNGQDEQERLRRAFAFVGIGKNDRSDVAARHDDYLGEAFLE
ncbi:MAG: hypothetical protein Q8O40_15320 [Chloroflexota bacterium]|nr:hypothetical protein [Chloroflexota bacterium]